MKKDAKNNEKTIVYFPYNKTAMQAYDCVGEFDKFKPYKNKIGGKTGTPERVFVQNGKTAKKNDAWYICYIKDCNVNGERHNLAVAVRMERINSGLSGRAMNLVSDVILPQLAKLNYIQYRN